VEITLSLLLNYQDGIVTEQNNELQVATNRKTEQEKERNQTASGLEA
jgi:hypothetical protein